MRDGLDPRRSLGDLQPNAGRGLVVGLEPRFPVTLGRERLDRQVVQLAQSKLLVRLEVRDADAHQAKRAWPVSESAVEKCAGELPDPLPVGEADR
jgi:hypothetical protein